jgi:hypothetical protein
MRPATAAPRAAGSQASAGGRHVRRACGGLRGEAGSGANGAGGCWWMHSRRADGWRPCERAGARRCACCRPREAALHDRSQRRGALPEVPDYVCSPQVLPTAQNAHQLRRPQLSGRPRPSKPLQAANAKDKPLCKAPLTFRQALRPRLLLMSPTDRVGILGGSTAVVTAIVCILRACSGISARHRGTMPAPAAARTVALPAPADRGGQVAARAANYIPCARQGTDDSTNSADRGAPWLAFRSKLQDKAAARHGSLKVTGVRLRGKNRGNTKPPCLERAGHSTPFVCGRSRARVLGCKGARVQGRGTSADGPLLTQGRTCWTLPSELRQVSAKHARLEPIAARRVGRGEAGGVRALWADACTWCLSCPAVVHRHCRKTLALNPSPQSME